MRSLLPLLLAATVGHGLITPPEPDPLVVETNKGYVRGVSLQAATGKWVDAFLGIPFAAPPLGAYRFRHPRPADPWQGVLNATAEPNSCVQINDTTFGNFSGADMWNANTFMSEDCLYLNVYVPKPRPRRAAVLVWIYGGGFYSGTISLEVYDPRILVSEQEIIYVAMNYRVASLGFLYLGRPEAPGNAGLFDQIMALEWIRDNIAFFGGNPHNVTLFGESAGASSVAFHMLSPLSRDLFGQAILQSGSPTVPFALYDRDVTMQRGLRLARMVHCPSDPTHMDQVVECLRSADPADLVNNEWETFGIVEFPFGPIIDGAVIYEDPMVSLRTGNFKKTKMLIGSNKDEGTYYLVYHSDLFTRSEDVYVSRRDFLRTIDDLYPRTSPLVRKAIAFEYTDWTNPEDRIANRDAMDKVVGDFHFICGVNQFARDYAAGGNDVFMYYFVHRGSTNPWPEWMGVMHGYEIPFVFGEPLDPRRGYRPPEVELARRFMAYWANFVRTGNPNEARGSRWEEVYWPLHTATGREYLTLAPNDTTVGKGPRARQCAFWEEFVPELKSALGEKCVSASARIQAVVWILIAAMASMFCDPTTV